MTNKTVNKTQEIYETSDEISVMTYNVWMDSHQLVKRMKKIIDEINNLQPDIVCLQEVHSPAIKKLFKENLSQYYFLTSNHTKQKFKIYSYIPCILLQIVLGIIFQVLQFTEGLIFGCLFIFALGLLICSVILIPQITRNIINRNLSEYDTLHEENQQNNYELDWIGQSILIKKQKFTEGQILESKPFQTTAIILNNSFNIFKWIYIWVLISFLRPGYMIAKCQDKKTNQNLIICSCHLAIGLANQKRILQVKEMVGQVTKYCSLNKANNFLLCGDFNADQNQQEIKYLEEQNIYDVILETHGKDKQDKYFTWDNNNPYAKMMGHKEDNARLDYIYIGVNDQKNKNFKVVSADLIFKQKNLSVLSDNYGVYSDHYGVISKIQFQQKQK